MEEKDYYKTKEGAAEYIQMAKDVNSAELIEKYKSFLKADARLLELGSGPGTDWHILDQDFDVTGSDNSKEFLQHLASTYPTGSFYELDAVTINIDQKFNGIYSNKVMHHLTDDQLKASIERQYDLLHPEGIICHSFWKGEGSEIFKGLFVNYHSIQSLKTYFEDHFEILLIETYEEFEANDSIVFIGKKK